MQQRLVFLAAIVLTLTCPSLADDVPPAPSFDRVNYDRPDDYLVLHPSLGSADCIRAAAAPLKRNTPERTLDGLGTVEAPDRGALQGFRPVAHPCVAANSPVWQLLEKQLRAAGHRVKSFNYQFTEHLAAAKGGDLVITCVGDRLVLPPDRHDLLPIAYDEIQAKLETTASGVAGKPADDGTRVILLYTRDNEAMEKFVGELDIEMPR